MVQDGLRRRNFKVTYLDSTGSITANTITGSAINSTASTITTLGTTTSSSTNATISNVIQPLVTGSGQLINSIAAGAVISGGMWVIGSAGSATTPVPLIYPAAASAAAPLGICLATTASGANPTVLTRGQYTGLISEGTVIAAGGIHMGAGAALNCVIPAGSELPSRATCVMGGGSEQVVSIYLW